MVDAKEFLKKHVSNYLFLKWVPFLLAVLGITYGLWEAIPVGKNWDNISAHEAVKIATEGAAWAILLFIVADKLVDYHLEAQRVEHSDRQLNDVEGTIDKVRRDLTDGFNDLMAEFRERFAQLEQITAGDVRGVVCLGHPSEAIARISANIPDAIHVWNIRASFGQEDSFKYSGADESMVVDAISRFLSRNNARWIDVIGPEDAPSVDERMERVFTKLPDITPSKDCYICYRLYNKLPVLNFIALDYGGTRGKEVYFGFGRHKHDQVGSVFYSCNELISDMFINLHNSFREENMSCRYMLGSYLDKKSFVFGLWRSVAIEKSGKIRNIAYINVDGGPSATSVSGFVFDTNGIITGWFKSKDVITLDDKLIYIYYRVNTEAITVDEKAIAVYDFGDGATFVGKFLEVRTDNAINLYGTKASNEETAMFLEKKWELAPSIIAKYALSDFRVKALIQKLEVELSS